MLLPTAEDWEATLYPRAIEPVPDGIATIGVDPHTFIAPTRWPGEGPQTGGQQGGLPLGQHPPLRCAAADRARMLSKWTRVTRVCCLPLLASPVQMALVPEPNR